MRYLGMVQDMLETEYYMPETMDGTKTHYREVPFLEESQEDAMMDIAHKLSERQPLIVVPIPFSSDWIRQEGDAKRRHVVEHESIGMEPSVNKRERGDDSVDPPTKRKAFSTPDTSMDNDSMEEDSPSTLAVAAFGTNDKALRTNKADWWPAGCMKSDPNHCPVLAKLYYELESSTPRIPLNEVVELVGVLSVDPMDADFLSQSGGGGSSPADNNEWNDFSIEDFSNVTLPPPSLLPRLHVLCYNRVNLEQVERKESIIDTMDVDSNTTNYNDDRSFAIQFLSKHVFGGNDIAAEALLMALMSMAEREKVAKETWAPVKTPLETTLGCASLNLVLSSQASCGKMSNRLYQVLTKILPVVGSIDLHREQLGKTVVSPAKDESGRLDPQSPLQLPKGSALIINESLLTEGRIEARAEETLRALHSLTHSHSIPYRFEGMMNFNFEADYRVIVVSKATKSHGSKLLPCSMTMMLSEKVLAEDESTFGISEKDCERIRAYLAQCRCNNMSNEGRQDVFNVPLPKRLLEMAQNDFIQKRAEYRKNVEVRKRMQEVAIGGTALDLEPLEAEVGEADFHRWLTVARLQARSRVPLSAAEPAENQTWADTLRLDEAMKP